MGRGEMMTDRTCFVVWQMGKVKDTVWGVFYDMDGLCKFAQYMVDSVGDLSQLHNFIINTEDLETDRVVGVITMTTFLNTMSIRKRSFEERMKGVETWHK